jgi:hypothetical protein
VTLVVRAIVRVADIDRFTSGDLVPIRADRVAALASRRPDAPAPTEPELRGHDAITRAVHESAPSLPSRFGSVFADADALELALRSREDSLSEQLDRIGDRVELMVTLRWRTPRPRGDAKTIETGTAYLEARVVREHEKREAEQIVARLVEQLPCDRAFIRHSICPRDGVAAIVAILSTRDEVTTLRQHIGSFAERSSDTDADIHGPLPPYSFVS